MSSKKHKQTRRTVSVPSSAYTEALAFAKRNDIPLSQLAVQGLRAIMDGRIALEPTLDQSDVRRKELEARVPRKVFAQVAREVEQQAREAAEPSAKTPYVAIELNEVACEMVDTVASRQGVTATSMLETAVNRMLDHMETPGHVWCKACLESVGECQCNGHAERAVSR